MTVEHLLEAAAQLLELKGEAAVTTRAVARRAGYSVGTLYQYFPDRDAILVGLADQEQQRIAEILRQYAPHLSGEVRQSTRLEPTRALFKHLISSYRLRRGSPRQLGLVSALRHRVPGWTMNNELVALVADHWDGLTRRQLTERAGHINALLLVFAILGVLEAITRNEFEVEDETALVDGLCTLVLALRPADLSTTATTGARPAEPKAEHT